ncbi:MAG: 4Fe-4S dicluster domain-containing protein [Acidobacteria bacterium]|nr:4Fe-4S dicluster domain-containing protein [Acidobacteriota bacterium]
MSTTRVDRGRVEVCADECKGCLLCVSVCPAHCLEVTAALNKQGYHPVAYTGEGCTACGFCFYACPEPGAIMVFKLVKTA